MKLPTTEKEIKDLAKLVCLTFNFTDEEHATFVICQAINHLPRDVGWTTAAHFGDCVRRSLAAKAAASLGAKIGPDIHFRELKEYFKLDPTDQQLRDELHRLAHSGHAPAIEFLKEIGDEPVKAPKSVEN